MTHSARPLMIVALVLASIWVGSLPLTAQSQNPITAAREAFRRAQEEAKKKQEEDARRRQGESAPVAPASDAPAQAVQQPGQAPATPLGPQETARLAAAAGFMDVAGLKLGAPLAGVEPLLKSLNPKFTFRPQVEIIWPLDRAGIETQPPPTAPKSVRHLAAEVQDGKYTEAWGIQFAEHPNPAVVITIRRTVSYAQGTGPALDGLLEAVRKKYGPESATNASLMIPNSSQRAFVGRWYFDERGQALRGNVGNQLYGSCQGVGIQIAAGNPGLCGTLTILNVNAQATGNGVVHTLMVDVTNHPLEYAAQETNRAYLRRVEEERAAQQQKGASQRAVPKL
jgi:hypothetical protein